MLSRWTPMHSQRPDTRISQCVLRCLSQLTFILTIVLLGIWVRKLQAQTDPPQQFASPSAAVVEESVFVQDTHSINGVSRYKQNVNRIFVSVTNITLVNVFQSDVLFAGIEAHCLGSRFTLNRKRTGSHFVKNLTLFGHKLINGVDLTDSVFNLLYSQFNAPGYPEHRQNVLTQNDERFGSK